MKQAALPGFYMMENDEECRRLDVKTLPEDVVRQARWAGIMEGMKVLDAGCGVGKTTSVLKELVGDAGTVTGLDFSEARLEEARRRYGRQGIRFIHHDLRRPYESEEQFDAVWMRFLLEYFRDDPLSIVRNVARSLKPGGILCLIDLDHNSLNHHGHSDRLEKTIQAVLRSLEANCNFDPYAGRIALLRVHQGTLRTGAQLFVGDQRKPFKVAHLYAVQGNQLQEIPEALPGDVCAITKVEDLHYDTVLHDSHDEDQIRLVPLEFPTPMYSLAIEPKRRGDEQKISDALHKLAAEDPTFRTEHNATINQTRIETIAKMLISDEQAGLRIAQDLRADYIVVYVVAQIRLFGSPADAVGRRIRIDPQPWREVVGVLSDMRDDGLNEKAPTVAYWPLLMVDFSPTPDNRNFVQRGVSYVIRSSRTGSSGFVGELGQAVWSINPNLPLASVRTLQEIYDASLARTSFTLVMLGIAGGMALLLGVAGIYGVISYSVSQRTREIGIRIALGASSARVLRLILRRGVVLIAIVLAMLARGRPLWAVVGAMLFGASLSGAPQNSPNRRPTITLL